MIDINKIKKDSFDINEKSNELQTPRNKWILYPNDRAKIIWDQFLAIYIFISIILTPFNLAFRDYRFKNPKYSNFVYSLDAVFIIDIFMNFISAY